METQNKVSPKDVFLHLLSIAALYISAISFITLAFQFVNLWIPDPLLSDAYYIRGIRESIRWAVASLAVIFPVFLYASRMLEKSYAASPEKRNLRIRKWLLYFTIFIAAAVIIGDLVTLLYNFLNGDLTIKFLLKIMAVLFVAGAVFGYYLWVIRHEKESAGEAKIKFFVWAVVAVVAAAIIAGFFAAGSPFKERLRKLDDRRIQDLQTIQSQLISYWQRKNKLPENLSMLRDDISGFSVPADPETNSAYEYKKFSDLEFELCADFKSESRDSGINSPKAAYPAASGTPYGDNWSHGVGRICFERAIDPELYGLKDKHPLPLR